MEPTLSGSLLEDGREAKEAPPQPPLLARLRCEAGDLLAPVVAVVLSLPVTIAYVGVIISGAEGLKPSFSVLLSTCLLSLAASAFGYARASQFPTCSNVDFLTATFFGKLASMMREKVPEELLLVHMLVAQALFTALVGLFCWALAALDVLWVMRFLPYPVASGFNCAGGLLIMNGGLSLGTGMTIQGFLVQLATQGPAAFDGPAYPDLVATLLAAAVFILLLRFGIDGAAQLPLGFAMVSGAVYGLAWLSGEGRAELLQRGVFLENLAGAAWDASFVELADRGAQVHWPVFAETDMLILAISYVCLISFSSILFMASLHEVLPPEVPQGKKYNFTNEIRMQGQLNVLLGFVAGIPMASSLKFWLVIKRAGSSTRLWVWNLGSTMLLLYLFPDLRDCLGVLPKYAFSGLVVSIGYGFFIGTFTESKKRIAPTEWRFTVYTMVVTFFNVFAGILLGMMMTIGFFLLEYSSMTGIISKSTLAEVRSFAERWPEHAQLLDSLGHEVVIFWCSGYIFFGTAATIVEEIEDQLDLCQEVHAVIIDFERVPAVDASGVKFFMAFAANCLKRSPPVKVCLCGMTRRLQAAMREAAAIWHREEGSIPMVDHRRIEGALSWAEQLLISGHLSHKGKEGSPGRKFKASDLMRAFSGPIPIPKAEATSPAQAMLYLAQRVAPGASESEVQAFVEEVGPGTEILNCQGGRIVFQEGDKANSLYCILEGGVILSKSTGEDAKLYKLGRYHLNEEKGDLFVFEERGEVEFKHINVGGWLGSLEFCTIATGTKRTPQYVLTARATKEGCRALRIPFKGLRTAIDDHPLVGCGMMVHVSYQAGLESLELMGSTRMLPYRSSSDATFLALAEQGSPTSALSPLHAPTFPMDVQPLTGR